MERLVRINDTDVKYQVSYRDVHYPRLEFKTGSLLLVLPRDYKNEEEIIRKHRDWIYKKNIIIKDSLVDIKERSLELKRTDEEFRNLVHSLVGNFSKELKIDINKIFFRKMRSKWGSCSSRNNLTINTLLRYLPNYLIEYIVLHEMVHAIERKHNETFWNIIGKKSKNHQKYESDLLAYWFLVQKKIVNSRNTLTPSNPFVISQDRLNS